MSELVLGTAQFGTPYGVTNAVGRLTDAGVAEILEVARDGGIRLLDTAADYGDAASRIASLRPVGPAPGYVTKFSLPSDGSAPTDTSLIGSALETLDVDSLHGVMFHRIDDLHDPRLDATWTILRTARDDGRVRRIGASVYDGEDLALVLDRLPGLDLLQIPGNVLDRRLLDSPEIAHARAAGVEVHVRSAYLQGVLLADPSTLPAHLGGLAPALGVLAEVAAGAGITPARLALGFLAAHPAADAVLVGATTAAELRDSLDAWNAPGLPELPAFPDLPPDLLDPRRWAAAGAGR